MSHCVRAHLNALPVPCNSWMHGEPETAAGMFHGSPICNMLLEASAFVRAAVTKGTAKTLDSTFA